MGNKASRISFLLLLLLLMAAFGVIIKPFLVPTLVALIIAVICWPINQICLKLCRGRRTLAAALATVIVAVCILGPLSGILTFAAVNAVDAIKNVISRLEAGTIAHTVDNVTVWMQDKIFMLTQTDASAFNLRAKLLGFLSSVGTAIYEYTPMVFSATAGFFAGFMLVVLFLFIFFADGEMLHQALIGLVPLDPEHKEVLLRELSSVITGTFSGLMATAFAQGALLWIGYWIAGISNPLVWGAVGVGVSLIPVVGGPIMYVPPAVALLISGSTGKGIFLLVWGVGLVSTVDNIIKPLVMRGKVNVHPVLLALAIIGGTMWLGAIGFIVGPVVVALMLAMLRIYRREFL